MVCSEISIIADDDGQKTVAFKDLGVGSYFARVRYEGEVLQKIRNGNKNNTLVPYPGEEEAGIVSICPDKKVYALDVEIKWRFK